MKKLLVSQGKLACPKFHIRQIMKRGCPHCKFFKGVEGEFGTGARVICTWEKDAESGTP